MLEGVDFSPLASPSLLYRCSVFLLLIEEEDDRDKEKRNEKR